MKRHRMLRIAALTLPILLSSVTAIGSAEPQWDWTVYLRHSGPLRIGMPFSEVRPALRDPEATLFAIDDPPGTNGCTYLKSGALPDGVGVILYGKRVVRIDVFKGVRTASGAGIGDTEDRIKDLYPGHIRVERHPYVPDGHYLIYTPISLSDRAYGMVFETDGKVVTSYRAGFRDAVSWIEGCS